MPNFNRLACRWTSRRFAGMAGGMRVWPEPMRTELGRGWLDRTGEVTRLIAMRRPMMTCTYTGSTKDYVA